MNRLQTIDADTLQSTAYEPVSFVVDDLLPQGDYPPHGIYVASRVP